MPSARRKQDERRSPEVRQQLKRYNLTLPESCADRIATIRERTEASSDSEVVRRAIRLYEGLVTGALVLTQGKDKANLNEESIAVVADTLF